MESHIDLITKLVGLATTIVTLLASIVKARTLSKEEGLTNTLEQDLQTIQRSNIDREEKQKIITSFQSRIREAKITRRTNTVLFATLGLFAALAAAVLLLSPRPDERVFEQLRKQDPVAFGGIATTPPGLARSFLRGDYDRVTDYPRLLAETQVSLDFLSFTGYYFIHDQEQNLLEMLRRPVKVRFSVMDERGTNWERFSQACIAQGYDPMKIAGDTKSVREKAQKIQLKIQQNRELYKGELEIRWFSEPLFYQLILRDPATERSRLVQVGCYVYNIFANRPYFRSGRYATELADKMYQDFEKLWARALPQ